MRLVKALVLLATLLVAGCSGFIEAELGIPPGNNRYYYPRPGCVFTEGGLYVTMKNPNGGTSFTSFSFVGLRYEEVVEEVKRSYNWWATYHGVEGAQYFIDEAYQQKVHITLSRYTPPGSLVRPIERVDIYRNCH